MGDTENIRAQKVSGGDANISRLKKGVPEIVSERHPGSLIEGGHDPVIRFILRLRLKACYPIGQTSSAVPFTTKTKDTTIPPQQKATQTSSDGPFQQQTTIQVNRKETYQYFQPTVPMGNSGVDLADAPPSVARSLPII